MRCGELICAYRLYGIPLRCQYLLLVGPALAIGRNTLNRLDRNHEPIATPAYRFNKSGIFSRVCEGVSQFADCRRQAVIKVDKSVGGPQSSAKLLASDHLACRFQENGQ